MRRESKKKTNRIRFRCYRKFQTKFVLDIDESKFSLSSSVEGENKCEEVIERKKEKKIELSDINYNRALSVYISVNHCIIPVPSFLRDNFFPLLRELFFWISWI